MIHVLAASMPHLESDLRFLDSVSTEWRLYQADADISPDWAVTHDDGIVPVDKYWARVSTLRDGLGNLKYANPMVVVKAALCVSHGQADV